MNIVSPKSDFCLKELLSNTVVLRHFVSDVLGIEAEQIRSLRLANTFLWKRYKNQKLGILDILAEMNDDTKIDIELQVKMSRFWDKRQLFYLSKMYTSELRFGEDYDRLKRCVCISILDFPLTDSAEYHRVYRLRDRGGGEFSDAFEIHVLELNKELRGDGPVEEWIRFFNAESEEDLDMLKAGTKNAGILEAVKEWKLLNLRGRLRARYELYMKARRDRRAQDAYEREEGRKEGRIEGRAEGYVEGRMEMLVAISMEEGKSREETVRKLRQVFAISEEEAVKCFDRYAVK
ncbi:MAG: Rpn family recombination-promoting nuclease/putative transposase [Lachnospiraceae bacterium]|nr:Rpn family recombination-promoting nuclease/putative transposase [Lachnospiraceae bacterium]